MTTETTLPPPATFELGLALAGAISAGAYTAGVLDFLFQALAEWEKARGEPGVPRHKVVLKVIAGASAGAMTGALGIVALARGLAPEGFSDAEIADRIPGGSGPPQAFRCVLPSLYRSWVELPAMIGKPATADTIQSPGFLDICDLSGPKAGPAVQSLLNAQVLDHIKRMAFAPGGTPKQLPFVADSLHLYMMLSNMRGIPFTVGYKTNSFGMQTMGDRVHYAMTGLGCGGCAPSGWLKADTAGASIPISVSTLPARACSDLGDWDGYGEAALASGAFPVGLAARTLDFEWRHYFDRKYPLAMPLDVHITPAFERPADPASRFRFQSVDGGLVNNDPFDYAQYALIGHAADGPVAGGAVDKAIIMVSPFPEPPVFPPEGSPGVAMVSILTALFPALVNQARFRTSELAPAVDEKDFSRFLIAPLRRLPGKAEPERFTIASGLLGGFGGFLDELFRAHDFQLGRRNCQQFLRQSFLVPGDNVVLGAGQAEPMLPIIPLFGEAVPDVPLPYWPRMTRQDFDSLIEQVKLRADKLVPGLIKAQTANVAVRFVLRLGWCVYLRGLTVKYIRLAILADLLRRGQIEGRDAPKQVLKDAEDAGHTPEDVNAILAELANPAYDARTAAGIARSTKLDVGFISEVLAALARDSVPDSVRAYEAGGSFTLFERRPGFIGRRPAVRRLIGRCNKPKIG
jgi:hypothetical protein